MQQIVVNPPAAAARVPLSRSSLYSWPGSRRWTWRSINPGTIQRSRTSTARRPTSPRPSSTIRPPAIRTSLARSTGPPGPPGPTNTRPPRKTRSPGSIAAGCSSLPARRKDYPASASAVALSRAHLREALLEPIDDRRARPLDLIPRPRARSHLRDALLEAIAARRARLVDLIPRPRPRAHRRPALLQLLVAPLDRVRRGRRVLGARSDPVDLPAVLRARRQRRQVRPAARRS